MSRAPFLDGSVHYEETRVKKKKSDELRTSVFYCPFDFGIFFFSSSRLATARFRLISHLPPVKR